MTFQVLIVDDEPNVADSIALLLESGSQYDLELHTAYRAPQALEIMQRIRIDLLITDIQMPGMNGLALIREARKLWPDCAAVILLGNEEVLRRAADCPAGNMLILTRTRPDRCLLTVLRSKPRWRGFGGRRRRKLMRPPR